MSASHLVVFPTSGEPESPGDRIRRLQHETKSLAREHIELLAATLTEVSRLSGEIAEGGEIYPVGVRELSRRLTDEANMTALTLTAIIDRK
jgi:hypothetical protein